MDRSLKDAIQEDMTTDAEDVLENNFPKISKLVDLSDNGKVFLSQDIQEEASSKEKIELYLAGKLYSEKAEYSESSNASNKELREQLQMPKGTVEWALGELRNSGKIEQTEEGSHKIPVNRVKEVLEYFD